MLMQRRIGVGLAVVVLAVGVVDAQGTPPLPQRAVASVNGEIITRDDLAAFLVMRHSPRAVPQVLTKRLFMQALQQNALTVTKADVEALLAEKIAQRGEAAFTQALRRRGVTLEYVKAYELVPEVALRKLGDRLLPEAATNPDLVALLTERYGAWAERELVLLNLIRQELSRQNLTVTDADITEALAERAAKAGGEAVFNSRLRQTGITLDYLKTYELTPDVALKKLAEKLKTELASDTELVEEFTQRFGARALRQLALRRILREELTRRKLRITDADVDALLAERVVQVGGQAAFDRMLRQRRISLERFRTYDLVPEITRRKLTKALKGEVTTKAEFVRALVGRFGRQAAQQLVIVSLLTGELSREGLAVTDAEIEARLDERIARAGDRDTYLKRLRLSGVTLTYAKAYELTTEIALEKLAKRLTGRITADKAFVAMLVRRWGQQAVRDLVDIALFKQELARRRLVVTEREMADALAEHVARAGGRKAYEDHLARAGMTVEYLKAYVLRVEVARRKLTERDITITDETVQRSFRASYGEKRVVRHIVVGNILVANDVLKQLETGADFVDLVRKHSMDPRARRTEGLMPRFGKGGLADSLRHLEDAAFKLKIGQHSGIIQIGQYYHIIKLEEVIPPQDDVTFDDVKATLRQAIRGREVQKKSVELLKDLRKKAEVVLRKDLTGGRPASE